MRLGVLDVGSNSVHLLVVDVGRGRALAPVDRHKQELRLAELLQDDGSLGEHGTALLAEAVAAAARVAEAHGAEELLPFATSAVREATDSAQVLARVEGETGVRLVVLPGRDEARLTFLAARRWHGWSAGRLLCLDIGGGSLELAAGEHEQPEEALSVPLGAGRVTRALLPGDPPRRAAVAAAREHVRQVLDPVVARLQALPPPHTAVVTSKTFRSLARVCGAAPSAAGPHVERGLARDDLGELVERLSGMTVADRAGLPGVSTTRAPQLLAGALVAHETLLALDVDEVRVCPWALREGLVLERAGSLK